MLAIMQAPEPHGWTLDDLHDALATRGEGADFSSIYRAAEKLLAAGMLNKVMLGDGRARFELAAAHHDHLYCTACDELFPVPCVIGRDTFALLEARTGFVISGHRVLFSGLCSQCRAAAAPGQDGRR